MLAVLAAVAIPTYRYAMRARVAEAILASSAAKAAVAECFHVNGAFPPSNASGPAPGRQITLRRVADGRPRGTITLTIDDTAGKIGSKTIVLTPALVGKGSVDWTCASTAIDAAQLPSLCRASAN